MGRNILKELKEYHLARFNVHIPSLKALLFQFKEYKGRKLIELEKLGSPHLILSRKLKINNNL